MHPTGVGVPTLSVRTQDVCQWQDLLSSLLPLHPLTSCLKVCACATYPLQVWLDRNQWLGLLMLVDSNGEAYFPHLLQLPLPVLQQILGLNPDLQKRCGCCLGDGDGDVGKEMEQGTQEGMEQGTQEGMVMLVRGWSRERRSTKRGRRAGRRRRPLVTGMVAIMEKLVTFLGPAAPLAVQAIRACPPAQHQPCVCTMGKL